MKAVIATNARSRWTVAHSIPQTFDAPARGLRWREKAMKSERRTVGLGPARADSYHPHDPTGPPPPPPPPTSILTSRVAAREEFPNDMEYRETLQTSS